MAKLLVFKVGNQPRKGWKDGMLVTILDDQPLSSHMKKVFAVVRVPDALAEEIFVLAAQDDEDGYPTKHCVRLERLAEKVGDPALEAKWRSKDPVEPLDCAEGVLKAGDFEETKGKDFGEVPDANVVSAGSYTVGVLGDYANFAAAAADTVSLTGNILFTQISNVIDATNANWSAVDLNGFSLRITNNAPPHGDPTGGWIWYNGVTLSTRQIEYSPVVVTGGGIFEVDNLNVKRSNIVFDPARGVFRFFSNQVFSLRIHDICADYTHGYFAGPNNGSFISQQGVNTTVTIWNCQVTRFYYNNAGFLGHGYRVDSPLAVIENCSAYDCGDGFNLLNAACIARNCFAGWCHDQAGVLVPCFTNIPNATGVGNAADDLSCADLNWGVGLGNVTVIVPANNFVSLDRMNFEFLKLLGTAPIGAVGALPAIAGNVAGIRGIARPTGDGTTSISADQLFRLGSPGDYDPLLYHVVVPVNGLVFTICPTHIMGFLSIVNKGPVPVYYAFGAIIPPASLGNNRKQLVAGEATNYHNIRWCSLSLISVGGNSDVEIIAIIRSSGAGGVFR
jgi:hypothetical protein